MALLSTLEINEKLNKLNNWDLEELGKLIKKNFEFKDFKQAIDFVNNIAEMAELEDHHPDIRIHSYNQVEVSLSTHSEKGLTEKDFKVASEIDNI